jgi:uncharacterized protein (TIGR04255 family)
MYLDYDCAIMSTIFGNAPLVEIIAELRWGEAPQIVTDTPGRIVQLPTLTVNSTRVEEFFMRFGGEIYQLGFNSAERIVPAGFPLIPFQPVYRYRKGGGSSSPELFQVGSGLFSANAIPPYKSWDSFVPILERGIDALLRARDEADRATPFAGVSLRYIDAFGSEFTEGRSVGAFLTEVLGISIGLPPAISKHIRPGDSVKPLIHLSVPLSNNMVMNLRVAEGLVNNVSAIILDTTVAATTEVSAERLLVMDALNSAHSVIHETFMALTEAIHPLMKPEKSVML